MPVLGDVHGLDLVDRGMEMEHHLVQDLLEGVDPLPEPEPGVEIFHALRSILKKKGHSTGVGDEGGFAPDIASNRQALDFILQAVTSAGYSAGSHCGSPMTRKCAPATSRAGRLRHRPRARLFPAPSPWAAPS